MCIISKPKRNSKNFHATTNLKEGLFARDEFTGYDWDDPKGSKDSKNPTGSLADFIQKFYYCLDNWHICENIINHTYSDFHSNHTWLARAIYLRKKIKALILKP